MAQLDISEALKQYGTLFSENKAVSIIAIVAFLAISYYSLPSSNKEKHLPVWLPLEIGAASYLISSGGLGLSI
jgi:hypothetical protein